MRIMKLFIVSIVKWKERLVRRCELDTKCGILLDVKGLMLDSNGSSSNHEQNVLQKSCFNLGRFYGTDIEGFQLYDEIGDYKMLLESRPSVRISKAEEHLEFSMEIYLFFFSDLKSCQIMLTIAISISSCERSSSKLKWVVLCLRSKVGKERLSALALNVWNLKQ